MRKLGKVQEDVLRCIIEHKSWGKWSGWVWDSWGGTKRILDTLVKRGLVQVTDDDVYTPTKEGINYVRK